jgi:hypothetical protein
MWTDTALARLGQFERHKLVEARPEQFPIFTTLGAEAQPGLISLPALETARNGLLARLGIRDFKPTHRNKPAPSEACDDSLPPFNAR